MLGDEDGGDAGQSSGVHLRVFTGYLVALHGNTISIYNTTIVRHTLPILAARHQFKGAKSAMLALSNPFTLFSPSVETVALAVVPNAEPCGRGNVCTSQTWIMSLESLLPYVEPRNEWDVSWIRGPVMGVVMVGVIFYQLFKSRNRDSAAAANPWANGSASGMPSLDSMKRDIDRIARSEGYRGGVRGAMRGETPIRRPR